MLPCHGRHTTKGNPVTLLLKPVLQRGLNHETGLAAVPEQFHHLDLLWPLDMYRLRRRDLLVMDSLLKRGCLRHKRAPQQHQTGNK